MIVLHYTGMQFSARCASPAVRRRQPGLGALFGARRRPILQFVPEIQRAWHAGVSSWAGDTDINSCSIGIEIANPGHEFGYPDFPARQIAAVITLCRGILTRNIIPPERILAHSDVAPAASRTRARNSPGGRCTIPASASGSKPAPISDGPKLVLGDRGDQVAAMQKALTEYGYGIEVNGTYDSATHEVVTAFQRHFRPERVDGVADPRRATRCSDLIAHREPASHPARARPRRSIAGRSPLTPAAAPPSLLSVGWTAAPAIPKGGRGGKSGLHGQTVPDNVRRGQPQGQCHREQTAAARSVMAAARVKRCGKSAPRFRQRKRHGKPHREQDRIGTARGSRKREEPRDRVRVRRPGRLLQAPGNRRPRGMAVTYAGLPHALQNPAYRPSDDKGARRNTAGPPPVLSAAVGTPFE